MRVFVTGASGFVGRWLTAELEANAHRVLGAARTNDARTVDVTDRSALTSAMVTERPEAVVHLAAISSRPAAADNPAVAFEVNVGGTINLFETIQALPRVPAVLVAGSSEVYGAPAPEELPLTERSPLRPGTTYALSKVSQESVALAYAARLDLPVVVTRSFNHTGPGQRPEFVVPALARRIRQMRDEQAADIPVGNADVRRDFSDVRDVVRAYRLIVEALADGVIERGGTVLNVCSGEAVTIRHIIELLCAIAEVPARLWVDPTLVRAGEPEEIRGDASALHTLVGWRPERALSETLRDTWRDLSGQSITPPSPQPPPDQAVGSTRPGR